MFALVLTICLQSSNTCESVIPELYETQYSCLEELKHQDRRINQSLDTIRLECLPEDKL